MNRQVVCAFLGLAIVIAPGTGSTQEFVETAKLLVDDVDAGIELGRRVAVSGDVIVIGDPGNAEQGADVGAAYVFNLDGGDWVLQDKLLASDGAGGNVQSFGVSVAVDGDTIVVGNPNNDEPGADAGAAYVYVRNGATWVQQEKIMATDAMPGDRLGWSVAIEGDTIVAGARGVNSVNDSDVGAAYVFVRSGGDWTEQDKLMADISNDIDWLGSSVAVSGDTALAGAWGCCDSNAIGTGAAYVFVRDGATWSQQAKLLADDGSGQDQFGWSVAVEGDQALIGAPQDRVLGSFSGSVYAFERSGTMWTQADQLLPDEDGGTFGVSVSMSGDLTLFGDINSAAAHPGGATYIFQRTGNSWAQQQKFSAGDSEVGDAFGFASDLSGTTAVIGARGDDDLGDDAGAAYVFRAVHFDDVPSDYWAFPFIEKLFDSGITSGCGPRLYCPGTSVTRAQMAVFLERGMNGSSYAPPAATGNVFLDVGAGDFAASFIEQLFLDGITSGCGNNNYCPDAEVTRDQMAVFLLRAKYGAGYSPPPATGVFADVPLGYWVGAWIEQLAAEGITAGCGGGNYCPDAQVTRDQMAVFLVRTFGL